MVPVTNDKHVAKIGVTPPGKRNLSPPVTQFIGRPALLIAVSEQHVRPTDRHE
jgi:hypothetical protein